MQTLLRSKAYTIHEAVGRVIYDSKGEFEKGENVVMIPNTPKDDDKDVTSRDENVVADGGADGADGGGRMIAGLFRAEVEVTETGRLRLQLLQVPSELKIR